MTVSIVMPMHRPDSRLTVLCINSLNEVNACNMELVLCMNGRPRSDFDYILDYINKSLFDRLIVIYEREALSPGQARRLCLERCTNEWVLFLDSDDLIGKDLISHKLLHSNASEIIFGNAVESAYKGNSFSDKRLYRDYTLLLKNRLFVEWLVRIGVNPFPNSGTMVRLSTLRGCEYPVCHHEDFALYLALIIGSGATFSCDSNYDITYCLQADSVSGNKLKSRSWHNIVLASFFNLNRTEAIIIFMSGLAGLLLVRFLWHVKSGTRRYFSYYI